MKRTEGRRRVSEGERKTTQGGRAGGKEIQRGIGKEKDTRRGREGKERQRGSMRERNKK